MWSDEIVLILRVMLDDIDATKYTSDKLEQLILVAARLVQQDLNISTYTVSLSNLTLSPDPTETATLDESFSNLVALRAACISDKGSAATAASQAISVKDGPSAIDLRGPLQGKLALLKQGWCAAYQDAKNEYLTNQSGTAGHAVMTPFRTYALPLGRWPWRAQ